MIFDFGGGTFDVSLVSIEDGTVAVKSTRGDTHLGGQDIDNELIELCQKDFKSKTGIDISGNNRAMHRLRTACEKAKITLSDAESAIIEIEVLAEGKDYQKIMHRNEFNEKCKHIFEKCLPCVK